MKSSKPTIPLVEAVSRVIARSKQELIRDFDLSLLLARLFRDKQIDEIPLRVRKDVADSSDLSRVSRNLIERGLIRPFANNSYTGLYVRPGYDPPADRAVCFMDPLACLSHLSAMEWHGITDRRQKGLQITSPRGTHWTRLVNNLIEKELMSSEWLGSGNEEELSVDVRGPFAWRNFKKPIRSRSVVRYEESKWDENIFTTVDDVRVSTIGRTYLDMIRQPGRCGGIHHVLDCFDEHGRRHRNVILREVSKNGTKMDKTRIGYIFEERLDIKDSPTLNEWLETVVQRGGSRKLDAEAEYSPEYSERWCLSLNI